MRARILDPLGPRWLRWMGPVLGMALLGVGLFGVNAQPTGAVIACAGGILVLLGRMFPPRFRAIDAELKIGAGHVEISGAGILDRRIKARSLAGASATRTAHGVELAIVVPGRTGHPIVIGLRDELEAKRVRDALGIGHYGFGALRWSTSPGIVEKMGLLARCLGAFAFAGIGVNALIWHDVGFDKMFRFGLFLVALFVFLAMAVGADGDAVTLDAEGLRVHSGSERRTIPYDRIADVEAEEDHFALVLHGGERIVLRTPVPTMGLQGLVDAERDHLIGQIISAAQRAQGAALPQSSASARIASLGRGGEHARAWLARLDAMAQIIATGSGYRGAGFEEADLWEALEDHDAPADLRAGAARVLVQVDARHKARVEEILASVRQRSDQARIRVALVGDREVATCDLENVDSRYRRSA